MDLVIDRGNTFVKWAVFEDQDMRFFSRARMLSDERINSIFNLFPIENSIVSAVSHLGFSEDQLNTASRYFRLDHQTPLPFVNTYETPSTLGRDRIAAVAGAQAEWPDRNLLVLDTGTCLTIDFLRADGQYLGGNISPGPELRFTAMHEGTANLPLVSRPADFMTIGKTTEEALQNGGYAGIIAEIAGWILFAKEQFEDPVVVISGGDATSFATSIKNEIFVRPDLVLTGLHTILRFNVEN